MATWYAQYATNWSNTDPTSGGDPSVTSIWNSLANASGTWGTPGVGDTCEMNSYNLTWDMGSDGATFVAIAVLQGAGSLTFTGGVIAIGSALAVGVSTTLVAAVSTTATVTCAGPVSGAITVGTSGKWIQSGTASSLTTLVVQGGGICILAVDGPNSGITVDGGGILLITGGTWNSQAMTTNGVVLYYTSISTWSVSTGPNIAVAIPPPTKVITGTDYGPYLNPITPTYVAVAVANVLSTVSYGPSSSLTGTYVVVATTDVRSGVTYGAASALTGTLSVSGGGGSLRSRRI